MRETSIPDRSRARPSQLLAAYAELILDRRFLAGTMVLGGSIGTLYAQATMLPFILIERVGMTPTAFGIGMLMQTIPFFLGSVCLRLVSPRLGGEGSVRAGLVSLGLAGVLSALSVQLIEPSYLSIMVPVAFLSFGIAFLTPHMTTTVLRPFPHIAGSASAMMGFIQMGSGFLGGFAAAMIGAPVLAFGIIIPVMTLTAIIGYYVFQHVARRAVAAEAAAGE